MRVMIILPYFECDNWELASASDIVSGWWRLKLGVWLFFFHVGYEAWS